MATAGGDAGTSCEPGSFLECSDSDTAVYCDDQGTATVPVECGSECNAEEQLCYCEPETRICSGDQLIQCSTDGKVDEIVTCPLGCEEIGARCFDVEPSNDLAGYLDMTPDAPDVVLHQRRHHRHRRRDDHERRRDAGGRSWTSRPAPRAAHPCAASSSSSR